MPPKRKANTANRAKKSDTIFFYMPNDKPHGVFCQWRASPIVYGPTITFSCAEQFLMFCKAIYFSDEPSCTLIMATSDPKEQKRLGKQVAGFDEMKWDVVKSRVARVGNWYKFTHPANRAMKDVLLGTGERELVEAASRDRVWGVGFNANHAESHRREWGLNLLGKALMDVRDRLGEKVRAEAEYVVVEWDWDGELGEERKGIGGAPDMGDDAMEE
ncbi:DUF1768-domain-containing protein [Dothidotthia symphoricarpi CBS 119687]|uniref:DUF1768-domain-containing protein n=1 Tax=Dothidotthia symphoricarpi CBS 119687 TaxID=1392245 RepID=A0A6A6AD20_9PLEO|nr:DUF1768-domain-containing protein [Dothidotthia symphoricarpi CBS 119687]KAF2128641.1 DUF1768-domain-containing protein [Dothidotthia symphoricarpi CBS 119687]